MTRPGQSHPAPDDGTVGRDAEVAATESPVGALLERRLCEIVEAVGGREVGTNGRELWFRPASLPETEIRLGSEFDAPSYDRSANLAISYSGRFEGTLPPALLAVVGTIKSIDDTRLHEAAERFSAVAPRAVRRFSDAIEYRTNDEEPGSVGRLRDAAGAEGAPSPDGRRRWTESHGSRIRGGRHCRRASSTSSFATSVRNWSAAASLSLPSTGALARRHSDAVGGDGRLRSVLGVSENLLAHIPDTAIRILDVGCGLGANAKLLRSAGSS